MKSKYNTKVIVDRINTVARQYKTNLVGKTFLLLYEGRSIEIMFKSENFLHLCGVDTVLYAKDFYRKAVKGQLQEREIGFSNLHPYVFADIKTRHLTDVLSLLNRESLVLTDVSTQTKSYKLGTTDLEVVICFDSQFDDNGEILNNILIPYSLRVEEITNSKFNEIYEVDYVLSKETGAKEYNRIEFGNTTYLTEYLLHNKLSDYIINVGGNEGGDDGDGNIGTSVSVGKSNNNANDIPNGANSSNIENNNMSQKSSQELFAKDASNQMPIQSIVDCYQEDVEDYEIDL